METKEAIAAVIKEDGIDSAIAWIAGVVDEKHSRIEELEAALREIIDMHPFKDPEGDASIKAVVDLMFSINRVARAALGEKKDD